MARRLLVDHAAGATADRLDWPRRGLSEFSRRVSFAACEAMICDYDERGELAPPAADVCEHAVDAFDHAVGRASPDVRRGFLVLSVLLELLPLFVIGVPGRMSRLPLAKRLGYFEALEASRLGLLSMLFVAFKVPLCIPAFEHEALLRTTGFDRPSTTSRRGSARTESAASPAAYEPARR